MKERKPANFSISNLDKYVNTLYYDFIHEHLSYPIKKVISKIIFSAKVTILSRIKHLHLTTYLIQGTDKKHGSKLSVILFGDKTALSYFCEILFSNDPQKKNLGKVYVWNINKKIKHFSPDVDTIFIKTDRFFSRLLKKNGFMILPEWVEMTLDIPQFSQKLDKKLKRNLLTDIEKVKNNLYTYEISEDFDKFEYFLDNIYLPYVHSRHGKLALYESTYYPEIKSMFEKGKMLLVKHRDNYIAGLIIYPQGKIIIPLYMGVINSSEYLSKGAGAALFLFLISWAEENGFKTIDFGGARPFLNDGGFQYKRKWGMSAKIGSSMFGIFGFKICKNNSNAIIDFIEHNPLICIDKNKLKGVIFLKQPVAISNVKKIWQTYYTKGISELKIIYLDDFDENVKEFVNSNYEGEIVFSKFDQLC